MAMLSLCSTLGKVVLISVFVCEYQTANAFQTTSRFSPGFTRPTNRESFALFQSSITADLATTTIDAAVEPVIKQATSKDGPPPLGTILKMLPKESFVIDTQTGLTYFGIDLLAVMASLGFLNAVVTSDLYHALPIWGQALTVAPLQVLVCFDRDATTMCQKFDHN